MLGKINYTHEMIRKELKIENKCKCESELGLRDNKVGENAKGLKGSLEATKEAEFRMTQGVAQLNKSSKEVGFQVRRRPW